MTLEQRLVETLHQVDGFDPSPDLFARVARSLDEDEAHRRRVWIAWVASTGSLAVILLYLGLVVSEGRAGALVIHTWAAQLLETVVAASLVFVLAPLIRRFGGSYVDDVFRLEPATATRFLRLLDVAYYLTFVGLIIADVKLTGLGRATLLGPALESFLDGMASLLVLMGLLHAVTLLVLPVVGLVFSSLVRRAARHEAGAAAPVVSPGAARADRLATLIVWGAVGLGAVLFLIGVGLLAGLGISEWG